MSPLNVTSTLLFTVALATQLTAQSGYSAYIPSNTPATGACSSIPMGGFISEAQFRAQRTQIVVTAAELGNQPRRITNLAFAPCGSGLRKYGRLVIHMGHQTGPMTTTYDNNFVGGLSIKVLERRRVEWPTTVNQWNNIGLSSWFDYDPAQGNLLIQIQANNADFIGTDPTITVFGFATSQYTIVTLGL